MIEANPFAGETVEVYETALPEEIPATTRGIRITREPKYVYGPTPDLRAVNAWIARVPKPEQIAVFVVDYDSALTAVPDIRRFVDLRYAHIAGRYVERYDSLYGFEQLDGLFLVSYKKHDLSEFVHLNLQRFRAIRGRITRLRLYARSVLLQSCSKLTSFDDCRIESLTLEACNRVDLDTIPRIDGLRSLSIEGRPLIASLDFLDRCPLLEALAITVNPLTKTDLRALYETRTLQRAFLGSASKKLLAEIGRRNPNLFVTNGEIAHHRGGLVPARWW